MWRLFWEAPFSGSHDGGANARMAELAKRRVKRFPEDQLTPLSNRLFPNTTLDAVVERMSRRGESTWE